MVFLLDACDLAEPVRAPLDDGRRLRRELLHDALLDAGLMPPTTPEARRSMPSALDGASMQRPVTELLPEALMCRPATQRRSCWPTRGASTLATAVMRLFLRRGLKEKTVKGVASFVKTMRLTTPSISSLLPSTAPAGTADWSASFRSSSHVLSQGCLSIGHAPTSRSISISFSFAAYALGNHRSAAGPLKWRVVHLELETLSSASSHRDLGFARCTISSRFAYLGNYSYYLMKKELAEAEAREEREAAEKEHEREKEAQAKHHVAEKKPAERETRQTAAANEAAEKRREEEKKRAEIGRIQSMSDAKREEMVQRAEAEIAMAEAELKGLEFQMNDPAIQADPQQSQAIAEAYAAKEKEIEMRYEKWERLTEA